jgi:hypothetical protein
MRLRYEELCSDPQGTLDRVSHFIGVEPVDFSLAPTGTNPLRDGADLVRLTTLLRRLALDTTLACFIKPVIYGSLAARMVPGHGPPFDVTPDVPR